jgi:hypothetical protein
MPECIVCKGYYPSGTTCPRCGSDNRSWIVWRKSEPAEREGLLGLLYFTEPHVHMPFLITALALAFGLMGIAGIWDGIILAVRLLAVAGTVGCCLLIIQGTYAGRYRLREEYLLEHVQRAGSSDKPQQIPNIHLSAQLRTMLIPVTVIGFVLFLNFMLIQSELLWKIARWLVLEPYDQGLVIDILPPEVQERMRGALPMVLLVGYVGLFPTLVYASSMTLAQGYARRMNQMLPHPIFLQGELLARVVQDEAQRHLSRELGSPAARHGPPQSTAYNPGEHDSDEEVWQERQEWTWEELERTIGGGVKFTAWVERDGLRVEETITGQRAEYPRFVSYTIEADAWGRIVRITRGTKT